MASKNKLNKEVTALIVIIILVLGGVFYLLVKSDQAMRKDNSGFNKIENHSSSTNSTIPTSTSNIYDRSDVPLFPSLHVAARSDTDNAHYNIVKYPFKDSPYFNIALTCMEELSNKNENLDYAKRYMSTLNDFKLVSFNGETIIPSLRKFTATTENSCLGGELDIYSKPENDSHIYLQMFYIYENDAFNPGLYKIYDLNLSDLSMTPLKISRVLINDERIGDYVESTTRLLPDGKHVIKWTYKDIYLVDLANDSSKIIYSVPEGTWLVSSLNPDMGSNGALYKMDIMNNYIKTSLYAMETASGSPITIDRYGNIDSNSGYIGVEGLKTKFLKNIEVPF
jgi:hypothetical protein